MERGDEFSVDEVSHHDIYEDSDSDYAIKGYQYAQTLSYMLQILKV